MLEPVAKKQKKDFKQAPKEEATSALSLRPRFDSFSSRFSLLFHAFSLHFENVYHSVAPKESYNTDKYAFPVDYNDCFETSSQSYVDIVPVLCHIASQCGKTPSELIIYDPFYCDGATVEHLAALGFPNTINRNRDFYSDVEQGASPHAISMFRQKSVNLEP